MSTSPNTPTSGTGRDERRSLARHVGAVAAILAVLAVAFVVAFARPTGGGDSAGASDDSPDPAGAESEPVSDEDLDTGPSTADHDGTASHGGDPAPVPGDADHDAGPTDGPEPDESDLDETDDSAGYPDWSPPSEGDDAPVGPPDDGDETVELEPVGDDEPEPSDPCDAVVAAGRNLLVTEDPTVLSPGAMSGALTVRNCGGATVAWTAATKPSVALSSAAGSLAANTETAIGFTIDADQWSAGAIDFKIKVSEPGANTYVDVHAFKPTVGIDVVPEGLGLTAGEGSGGCAHQCITKAWLTPNATSPNVSLEVAVTVPADIDVYVSTQPPVDPGGEPHFPGVAPIASSGVPTTSWTTPLAPLQASTTYHIIVSATDEHDNTAYRVGTFTTLTPIETPDGFQAEGPEPGCAMQCITKALLAATGEHSSMHLDVDTHTPATIDVYLSTEPPGQAGEDPDVSTMNHVATSGGHVETWETTLAGLEGDTTYHIVVRATDANGNRAFQAGTFHTADEPPVDVLVTFHRIHVSHDGDSSPGNRGELSFRWSVNGELVGSRGEDKIDSGTTIGFSDSNDEWLVHDVEGFLPLVAVAGLERDADGIVEFCSMGLGVPLDHGHSDDCDAKWNVASSGIVPVDSLDSLLRCSELGVGDGYGDEACSQLVTVSHGDDYPRFTVVVSFQVV